MSARDKYSDRRWRRLSTRFLRDHPICEDASGCDAPATDVHHVDGQGLSGPRAYDETNWQALCHSHHSRITAAEHGWGTRPPRKRTPTQHPGLIG